MGPGREVAAGVSYFPVRPWEERGSPVTPCFSFCLVLLSAMWLGCIWLRIMIFLTLQRNWKILKEMWKLRRNLPVTNPKSLMLTGSSPHKFKGCNSRSSYQFQVEVGLLGISSTSSLPEPGCP